MAICHILNTLCAAIAIGQPSVMTTGIIASHWMYGLSVSNAMQSVGPGRLTIMLYRGGRITKEQQKKGLAYLASAYSRLCRRANEPITPTRRAEPVTRASAAPSCRCAGSDLTAAAATEGIAAAVVAAVSAGGNAVLAQRGVHRMIEQLHYLRQAIPFLRERFFDTIKKEHQDYRIMSDAICRLAEQSTKFIMPQGGRIFNDAGRGLPDELHLPYPSIVIEYRAAEYTDGQIVEKVFGKQNTGIWKKRIVVATERDDRIFVYSILGGGVAEPHTNRYIHPDAWVIQPFYITMHSTDEPISHVPEVAQGLLSTRTYPRVAIGCFPLCAATPNIFPQWEKHCYYDMIDEGSAVLELIEALTCANVATESLPIRKVNKSAAERGAIPFDEYKILVITNSATPGKNQETGVLHRSPREHLRRGHIRILPTGMRIWVQSCVVNRFIGSRIFKDYEVRTQ